MKYEDNMLYMIENYISNTLENLYEEQTICEFDKQREEDIKYLENLNTDDFLKISDLVFDEELRNKMFENIEYYLWRFKTIESREK